MFQLAIQLVNQSNRNIFLTGKAGTGKTTFLKYIRENCPKQMAIVAPTGVAAINAGGVTMHSFFQLPLFPFIPAEEKNHFGNQQESITNRHSLVSRLRFNSEKKKILRELELLVIDEVSMVRSDTLDAVDTVLRHVRQKSSERFGGVQLLFIGDMMQLPPVIKEEEWKILSNYYPGPHFFDSKVLENEPPLYVEFNKIYRQSEEKFIRLLNQVRHNELDEEGMQILQERFQPQFRRKRNDGFIILTTHNNKAAAINSQELELLDSPVFNYEAEIKDEFSDRAFPAEVNLQLKTGAQVMFIRNESADSGKRFFNGKLGIVSRLENDCVWVKTDQGSEQEQEIEVKKETWENVRYSLNKSSRQLDTEVLGSFVQYPLRLAWAITIHKSQGLTFEKAIIDAGAAFAPGQVYVALSRCTTLEGMILQSPVRASGLSNDERIVSFSNRNATANQLQEELILAKRSYLKHKLFSIFDFNPVNKLCKELIEYVSENNTGFNKETTPWINGLNARLQKIGETAQKFQRQLETYFADPGDPFNNPLILERLTLASGYFIGETAELLKLLDQSPAITDSTIHAKEYNDLLREIFTGLAMANHMAKGLNAPLDIDTIQRHRLKFQVPAFSLNSYAGGSAFKTKSPHPELHRRLRKLRDAICFQKDLPIYIVAGSNTLEEVSRYLPQTREDLKKISGFGDVKVEKWGQQFLELVIEYCCENNLVSNMNEIESRDKRVPARERNLKTNTKAESVRLFKQGLTINEIASRRSLSPKTIEEHLVVYVGLGEIALDELMPIEKRLIIEAAIKEKEVKSLTSIKERLDDTISYAEIKFVLASMGLKTFYHPNISS